MSEFSCPIVQIQSLSPVPNSDKLELTLIDETPCVVRKGQLSVGDLAVYIPLDSMVPMTKPQFQGLGIKTERELYRVKAVRLRGTYSEGLLVPFLPEGTVEVKGKQEPYWKHDIGFDMAPIWGIVKYEEPEVPASIQGTVKSQQDKDITWAPKYNVENLLKNRHAIPEGTQVIVTEKIHGCNGRFVYGPDVNGKTRLMVGSHNVWKKPFYRQNKYVLAFQSFVNALAGVFGFKPFADPVPDNDDVWWTVAKRLKLAEKLSRVPKMVFYGEVYGSVQDLKYSVPGDEKVRFRVFDIYDAANKVWLPFWAVHAHCSLLQLEMVPVLYRGPYIRDTVDPLRTGVSTLDGVTLREGFVIRPEEPEDLRDKQAYKYVSEEYKLRKGTTTEFH